MSGQTSDGTEQVPVDRDTLETLYKFTYSHISEYGWSVEYYHALIDAGIELGVDDPTPPGEFDRIDPEALRDIDGDEAVDSLRERWEQLQRDGERQ